MDFAYLFIAGLLGGFFAGLLGIGGGIIYIAILPYALRAQGYDGEVLVSLLIANSLLATFFAALFALIRHYKNKNIFIKESVIIGLSGSFFSIILFRLFVETGAFSFTYFNIFIIAILLFMMLRNVLKKKSASKQSEVGLSFSGLFGIGTSGGILAAFSGLGGGAIVVPLLVSFAKMDIRKASSISMGFILISAFSISIYNILASQVDVGNNASGAIILPVIMPLILGVVISASPGVRMAKKLSSKTISLIFVIFILLIMVTRIFDLIQGA